MSSVYRRIRKNDVTAVFATFLNTFPIFLNTFFKYGSSEKRVQASFLFYTPDAEVIDPRTSDRVESWFDRGVGIAAVQIVAIRNAKRKE